MAKSKGGSGGGKGVHTTPNPNGKGWVNQSGGGTISRHRTKGPAVERGKSEAKDRQTEHTIHKQDGTIGEKNSYGNDPNPPRDKK
jgi:hypothetical protein